MKNYGAIRKLMLILLLSILGSYCIGADSDKNEIGSFDSVVQSTHGMAVSIGNYCYKLWSELVHQVKTVFGRNQDQNVKIQNNEYIDNYNCTDGKKDCQYNEEFFNDSWFSGKMDEDPTTHFDVDNDFMKLVKD